VFGTLPLAVKWDNIYIDDNNRHQQGQIDALSKGIDSWAHQYDVNQGEGNAIYVPNGTLDSVYAANGQVCYSLSGSESSVCADYPPNTNVVVVRDGEGNQYVVTIYPEPATVEGPFNYMVNLGDSTSLLDENDNVVGEFKIISENPYCASCTGIIQQFHDMFPNIKLILVDGAK